MKNKFMAIFLLITLCLTLTGCKDNDNDTKKTNDDSYQENNISKEETEFDIEYDKLYECSGHDGGYDRLQQFYYKDDILVKMIDITYGIMITSEDNSKDPISSEHEDDYVFLRNSSNEIISVTTKYIYKRAYKTEALATENYEYNLDLNRCPDEEGAEFKKCEVKKDKTEVSNIEIYKFSNLKDAGLNVNTELIDLSLPEFKNYYEKNIASKNTTANYIICEEK